MNPLRSPDTIIYLFVIENNAMVLIESFWIWLVNYSFEMDLFRWKTSQTEIVYDRSTDTILDLFVFIARDINGLLQLWQKTICCRR